MIFYFYFLIFKMVNLTNPPRGRVQSGGLNRKILSIAKPEVSLKIPVKSEVGANFVSYKEKSKIESNTIEIENKMPSFSLNSTQLYFMSWEDVVKLSVCEIFSDKFQGEGSLGDPRLGVLEQNVLCKTCHKTNLLCPGHPGRIKFNYTFPHPSLIKFIINLLQSVCNCCGSLLLDEKIIQKQVGNIKDPFARIKSIAVLSKKLMCTKKHNSCLYDCKSMTCIQNPIYKMTDPKETYKIFYTYDEKNKNYNQRTIEEIKSIFKSISERDLRTIGFENGMKAENLLLEGIPVMPIQARPYNFQEGEKKQDYISVALADIIKFNNSILTHENDNDDGAAKEKNIMDLYKVLYHYIDNSDGTYFKSPDEPILTIKQKLIGKEGYIREFVCGKRNDFVLRTVAGPGRLPFGYVGIPEISRRILTFPEKVTPYNHKRILDLYNEGQVTSLIYNSDKNPNLTGSIIEINDYNRDKYQPHVGDVVERWGEEGDLVLTNRQPTLHHFGCTGHRVIYHSDKTIKCHSSITTPYNLDYDGDEENLYWLRTVKARAECKNSSNITSYVMNDQSNRPIMGLVFNCPKSAWLMSKDSTKIDPKSWNEALLAAEIFPERIYSLEARLKKWGVEMYSGKALFSLLLPEDFYYNHGGVKIRDGILIKGSITKNHIGPVSNSIVHYLYKMHTKSELVSFFTQGQYLLDWFIAWYGFSVGYSSCIIDDPDKIKTLVKDEISKAMIQIESLGDFRLLKTHVEKQKYEAQVTAILNNVETIGKSISLKALSPDNPFNVMAISKSKGTVVNIAQIVGLLGQQSVNNRRPVMSVSKGKRCLVHYEIDDPSLESRGFVSENFLEGVSPGGFFFHCAAGREGLVATAVATAESGAMHRRINKVLEDCSVNYRGCVVDKNTIFQYSLGDGFAPKNTISVKSNEIGMVNNFIDYSHVIGKLNCKYGSME